MNFEWRTGGYDNPRLHYLYRGNHCLGTVSMLGNLDHIRGYSVYLSKRGPSNGFSANQFQCIMPTLDEAKDLLQPITGAQL